MIVKYETDVHNRSLEIPLIYTIKGRIKSDLPIPFIISNDPTSLTDLWRGQKQVVTIYGLSYVVIFIEFDCVDLASSSTKIKLR